MLTRPAVLIFIFSICMIEGSKSCPTTCKCTGSGREVDCSGKELKEIPEIPVSKIMTLNVSYNNISVPVPPNASVWGSHLKFLYLSNNHIKDVVKSDFQRLPKLKHVYLDHNLITDIDEHAFEENTKLSKLILNGNKLTLPKGTEFLIVPSLGWIELENCSITDLPINMFKYMSNLVSIRLSNNNIEQLHSELFSHLRRLKQLHLEGNQIKQIDHDIFKTNHKLHSLYLRSNPFDNFNGTHFLHASSLLSLDISFCNITKIPNKYFSNLHDLLSLNLEGNLLKSFDMRALPENLEVLDISGNSLQYVNVTTEMIRLFGSLKHLNLTNNNFTCQCRSYPVWTWCETLRTENGVARSCEEFCPDVCGEQGDRLRGETAKGNDRTRTNTISEENDTEPETSDNPENNDVESVEAPGVVSGKDANDPIGELRVNDEHESAGTGKLWSIITYSCIGLVGGLCLIGAIALVTDTVFSCRKSRDKEATPSATNKSFRNVKLELMDANEDRQETTPLSVHRGFDFVSQPTNAQRNKQPGQLRHS